MMYGMGVNSSSSATGTITERRSRAASTLLTSVTISVSAFSSLRVAIISRVPGQVTPAGANRKAGKDASSIAMGPCSRSALEKRSATT